MVTDEQTPVPKRKCPDNALLRSGRYSISAAVFERMQRNAHSHEELTPERIYPIVHQWFENRRDRVGTCPLDVRTVVNDSLLPEVFGWPSWHRRKFDGTRHSDQLWQHTCGVLQRPTTATNQSTTSKEDSFKHKHRQTIHRPVCNLVISTDAGFKQQHSWTNQQHTTRKRHTASL